MVDGKMIAEYLVELTFSSLFVILVGKRDVFT